MMKATIRPVAAVAALLLGLFLFSGAARAQPPARVAVGEVSSGRIAPSADFIGTLYFKEVSMVAAEVSGKVVQVSFDEGERVEREAVLVSLDTELLEKSIEATEAGYEQVLTDLEEARKNLERIESLYSEKFVSDQDYDEVKFRVLGLEKRATSLKADLEGLSVELSKKQIRAPFSGVVTTRDADRGEWLSPGAPVATLARVDVIDLVVDVPEETMLEVKKGKKVSVKAGGKTLSGTVRAVIPKGDIKTRTFPIRIRVTNSANLAEGMDARVSLPIGPARSAVIVPRDAVITKFGRTVVFAVIDGKAKMLPVEAVGYTEKTAGVKPGALKAGMKVVTKGNERVRDGQQVITGSPPKGGGGPKK